jgi:hypothetical protein
MPRYLGTAAFIDGIDRAVYDEDGRQFVHDDAGHKVYGVWIYIDEDECDRPVVVEPDDPNW